jgi:hypothetical protein
MVVWGGLASPSTYFNTGGRYNPGTDGWTATNTSNAPSARYAHTAVWTGSEMIVWGGTKRHEQFQHRRQILRAIRSYTNADSSPDPVNGQSSGAQRECIWMAPNLGISMIF